MEEKDLVLRVDLKGDLVRKFKILKEHYGMENNTDLIRFLIAQRYAKDFGN